MRGLKYHQESKIEVAHQVGRKTDLRFRALAGSVDKKIDCTLKYQSNLTDPATKAAQQEVKRMRARKYGEKALQNRAAKVANKHEETEARIKKILAAPELTEAFPTLLDLTVMDRQQIGSAPHS